MCTLRNTVISLAFIACLLDPSFALDGKAVAHSTNPSANSMMQMPIVAPLFIEDGTFSSTLVLVNAGVPAAYADVTVRSLDGRGVLTKRIQLSSRSQRQVPIGDLLDAARAASITSGSITVEGPGVSGMSVLASLSLTRRSTGAPSYIDEELAMPSPEGSSVLRGIANGDADQLLVAITSLSNIVQHIRVQCFATEGPKYSKSIDLAAGETLLTEACAPRTVHGSDYQTYLGEAASDSLGPLGIDLASDGMPGSFAAFGMTFHGERHSPHFSAVPFSDPKMVMSSTTVFTGVPVGVTPLLSDGRYTPVVSVSNFSDKTAHMKLRYSVTSGETAKAKDIPAISIPAHSSRELKLNHLEGVPEIQNSFVVEADSSPGDFMASLSSQNHSQQEEVDLLGKDFLDAENAGTHPWSIQNGSDSTLLLFNPTSAPLTFTVIVPESAIVWHKNYTLGPMQTKALGILNLINDQVADDKGTILSHGISSGEITWFTSGPSRGRGRLLQSNRQNGMARNFSCGYYSSICGGDWSPATTTLSVGQDVAFGDLEARVCLYSQPNACIGTYVGDSNSFNYLWQSQNQNVASIANNYGSTVDVQGSSPGSSLIYGTVTDQYGCSSAAAATATVLPNLALSRLNLTQVQATGSPNGGSMTYSAAVAAGQSIASVTYASGNSATTDPNVAQLVDPNNPNSNGSPSPGGLAQITASYAMYGTQAQHTFSVPTFGMSCYYTAYEGDWGTAPNSCVTVKINGTTYSGAVTNPNGLTGTYCSSFIAEVKLQGSAALNSGQLIQYNTGTAQFVSVSQINAADGSPVVAGRTVARDRSIIPRGGYTVDVDGVGTGLLANDTGGAIVGYRLDFYNGSGQSACSGFNNVISVAACNPGTSACPASAVQ